MPVYLLHGFRWLRALIRIHIIRQRLDDAAAEWLIAPRTNQLFMENFSSKWPDLMTSLPDLRLIEQHDPHDERTASQPYAYVASTAHEVLLSLDINEIQEKGIPEEEKQALSALRDNLGLEEPIAWYVVVCGDEDRDVPDSRSFSSTNDSHVLSGTAGEDSSRLMEQQ